jgi:hypothetical protein
MSSDPSLKLRIARKSLSSDQPRCHGMIGLTHLLILIAQQDKRSRPTRRSKLLIRCRAMPLIRHRSFLLCVVNVGLAIPPRPRDHNYHG